MSLCFCSGGTNGIGKRLPIGEDCLDCAGPAVVLARTVRAARVAGIFIREQARMAGVSVTLFKAWRQGRAKLDKAQAAPIIAMLKCETRARSPKARAR